MNQALYAHMNNKRKMEKKNKAIPEYLDKTEQAGCGSISL
jgi:hypothetical protein